MEVTVLGAGSWGTAMALVLARNGHSVRLLARDPSQVTDIRESRRNERYLPGIDLPDLIHVDNLAGAKPWGSLLVEALPSTAVRERLDDMEGYQRICVATKGLEPCGSLFADIIGETYPETVVCILSGPNLAKELVQGIPTVAVVACESEEDGLAVRDAFHSSSYRVYISDDVKGVELAGALKNVMAMAAGMSDGLGYGDNTKGSLLSRGLVEIIRLGMASGAKFETFLGAAGMADLVATASSKLSRNYRVGFALAQGRPLDQILSELGQVAEGVPTCEAAVNLARTKQVSVPIMEHVLKVIRGEMTALAVVGRLMERVTLREGIGEAIASLPRQ